MQGRIVVCYLWSNKFGNAREITMKVAIGLGLLAAGAIASAQVLPTTLYFSAKSIKDQKITLAGWGSGTIAEADGIALAGTSSIRVSSRNYFQGGVMTLGEPTDLAKKFDDKSNLFRLTFFLEDSGWVYGMIDRNQKKSGSNGLIALGKGGGPVRFETGVKTDAYVTPSIPFKPKIKQIRMIITTTDGKKSEAYIPIGTSQSAANALGWRCLSIPLQAINGFDRTNKVIQAIALSTDTVATMYLGAIDVVTDDTPIRGEINNVTKLNLALDDEVTLTASGEGGSSVLVYNWDFDDTDGIQIDDEGTAIKHKFRKPGKFNVTLTISDKYGLKKPFVTSFPVVVNP
jgi:hypothetical protein